MIFFIELVQDLVRFNRQPVDQTTSPTPSYDDLHLQRYCSRIDFSFFFRPARNAFRPLKLSFPARVQSTALPRRSRRHRSPSVPLKNYRFLRNFFPTQFWPHWTPIRPVRKFEISPHFFFSVRHFLVDPSGTDPHPSRYKNARFPRTWLLSFFSARAGLWCGAN